MGAPVTVAAVYNTMKSTLESIIDDRTDNVESSALCKQFCEIKNMRDNYEEDLEAAGPGMAIETGEGEEMPTGTVREGYITTYRAKKYALKLIFTEEVTEDTKYPEILSGGRRLKRAMWKAIDYDATQILVRGFNTAYVYGDEQPLWSASHTLPDGGTWSNLMGTPAALSVASLITATSSVRKFPGHDGLIEGFEPTRLLVPTELWATTSQVLNSTFTPTTNNFAEVNVVNNDLELVAVANKYWGNSSTNWALLTDCDKKINLRFRRRPRSKTWMDNAQELIMHGMSARWARGQSDPRCTYGVNI